MRTRRWLPWLGLVLTACAPHALVTAERQTVGGILSVEPGLAWNRVATPAFEGRIEVWTLDGPVLNFLTFFTGTADGEPLFTRRGPAGERPPVFRASMNDLQIEELFRDTLARNLGSPIAETRGLRGVTVGGQPAFRFETRAVGRDEVDRNGGVVGDAARWPSGSPRSARGARSTCPAAPMACRASSALGSPCGRSPSSVG